MSLMQFFILYFRCRSTIQLLEDTGDVNLDDISGIRSALLKMVTGTKTNRGLNQIKSLRFVVFVEFVMLINNPDSGTM